MPAPLPILSLDDFDYALPAQCIAQFPLAQRSASRLLCVAGPALIDRHFAELPDVLEPGDLLVMNDSRVLHARLLGRKESGGQVEVLVERLINDTDVLAQVRASKPPKAGTHLQLEGAIEVDVLGREGEFYRLRFPADAMGMIEAHGRLPLPPYIGHSADMADESRYQTVFAKERGSVAAPTAGLHFDEAVLAALDARGIARCSITLHVGAGTFQPVRVHNLAEHRMHSERYAISDAAAAAIAAARARGNRVIAVGTTAMRALESAAQDDGTVKVGAGETAIFITPGYRFRVAKLLLTNFHLPKSTLLMLVSAFGGLAAIRASYAHAIANGYRFFSYGDAMLLHPDDSHK